MYHGQWWIANSPSWASHKSVLLFHLLSFFTIHSSLFCGFLPYFLCHPGDTEVGFKPVKLVDGQTDIWFSMPSHTKAGTGGSSTWVSIWQKWSALPGRMSEKAPAVCCRKDWTFSGPTQRWSQHWLTGACQPNMDNEGEYKTRWPTDQSQKKNNLCSVKSIQTLSCDLGNQSRSP